ncbi:hypothetical protein TFLX_04525 [Thermoflexales bacterium]|nr:hypothetical protein TFLX_04525 [Thermoflexales bacterium]
MKAMPRNWIPVTPQHDGFRQFLFTVFVTKSGIVRVLHNTRSIH